MILRRPVLLRTVGSLILAALLGLNGWLLLLNLAKQGRLPDGFDRVPGVAAAAEARDADDGVDGELAGDDAAATPFGSDATVVEESPGTLAVDEWPGGRGPVPDGPPVPRQIRLLADGGLVVTGSAPEWSVVMELAGALGRRLDREASTIDLDVVWHPEASARLGDGEVVLDAPLTYRPGQIELPDGAEAALAPVVGLLAQHSELYVVVIGLVDDADAGDEVAAVALGRTSVVADAFIDSGVAEDRVVTSVAPADAVDGAGDVGDGGLVGGVDQGGATDRVVIRVENVLVFGPAG